tara:strand:- start:22118 stop:23023 length:906 start_codon:yes stop_codon:yes gene_type:complete
MLRYLITGASSYPGYKLTADLLEKGIDVHVLVRPETRPERLAPGLDPNAIHCIDGQTENLNKVVTDIAPDVVLHLASIYRREASPRDVQPMVEANMLFGIQLCEALALTNKPVHIINTGTFAQYYESESPRPLNLYATLKQAFDDALAYYRDAHGFLTTSLILQDVYGPGDWREKLIATIARAQTTGEALPLPDEDMQIDLVYIDDVVRAFNIAATSLYETPKDVNAKHFYVGSGETVRLSQVVAVFEKITGQPIKTKHGGFSLPERRISDPWQGKMLPGWSPTTSLETGIREYLAERSDI